MKIPPVFPFPFPETSERIVCDSYDASYTTDLSKIQRVTNYSDVTKLLLGFFLFYADFDFNYYVISPRFGKAFPVLEMEKYCRFKEGTTFKVRFSFVHMFVNKNIDTFEARLPCPVICSHWFSLGSLVASKKSCSHSPLSMTPVSA